MHGNQFSIDNNDNVVPYKYYDTPMTIQAAQQQINAILAGYSTASLSGNLPKPPSVNMIGSFFKEYQLCSTHNTFSYISVCRCRPMLHLLGMAIMVHIFTTIGTTTNVPQD